MEKIAKEEGKKEEKKGNKNVLKTSDEGAYIVETRKVERANMMEPKTYDLKVPKTLASAVSIYGEEETLKLFIESLKTKNDDSVARSGMPESEGAKLRSLLKGVKITPELVAKIEALKKEEEEKAKTK